MNKPNLELYQALILDHNKNPRNFHVLNEGHETCEGHNPLCGDHYHVHIRISPDGEIVDDISFEGEGCAISKASASMMTVAVKGKPINEVKKIFELFHALLTGQSSSSEDKRFLGRLEVFSGVCQFPARVKCASLVWHTLNKCLQKSKEAAKTE